MIISLGTRKACCKYESSKVNIDHLPSNGHPEIYLLAEGPKDVQSSGSRQKEPTRRQLLKQLLASVKETVTAL